MRRLVALISLVVLGSAGIADAEVGGPGGGVPPIYVDGARAVDIRDADGGMSRYYSIPSASVFHTEGDGGPCSFVSTGGGYASNGEYYGPGQTVYSERWLFIEGTLPSFGEPTPDDPAAVGSLDDAVRHFLVFCDDVYHLLGAIDVGSHDPMIDPRTQLTLMYDHLQLIRPVVFTNPVVQRWGGLITRYPTWLAVLPPAWTAQRSTSVTWRGWTMYLLARPVAMEFAVGFQPDADRPSSPFLGIVPCVAYGVPPAIDARSVPAMPDLPEQTLPGVNGPCTWTPPGPGTALVQARLTYQVTFWANAYTERQADYVWGSVLTPFDAGELSAVNVVDPTA